MVANNLLEDDVRFTSGADSAVGNSPGGSIIFYAGNDGREVLKFAPNGDFIHEGRVVTQDRELYELFVSWLKRHVTYDTPADGGHAPGTSEPKEPDPGR